MSSVTTDSLPDAYRALRRRVTDVVEGLSPEQLETPVAACPQWRVRDLVGHLAGVAHDVATGNLEGVATEPWTAAQVDARRGRELADVLAEWADDAHRIAPGLSGRRSAQLLMDAVTHEVDLHAALGRVTRPPDDALRIALGFATRAFGAHLEEAGLPAVLALTDVGDWPLGGGEPGATLTTSGLDLLRSLTGRRTWEQVAALDWSADPETWRPAFTWAVFTPPADPREPPAHT